MSNRQAVVVGGGVIGLACAYELTKAGHTVALIDKGRVGGGSSHGNCGYVSPSHVLPLAGPGVLWPTLKTLLKKNSPLVVRFRLDPTLWAWLWRFARRCNTADMLRSAAAITALLKTSRNLYDDLFTNTNINAEWSPVGLIFVLKSQAAHEHYAEVNRMLSDQFATPAVRYDGAALNELEPALKPGLAGGWLYHCDAQLKPDMLMANWAAELRRMGVTIREQCALDEIVERNGRAVGVRAGGAEISADAIVVATGAWTPLLHQQLGVRVPIQPGKGYSMTMSRPSVCPKYPMIFEEHRVAVTPFRESYRLGSTMEFAGYDASMNRARLENLTRAADIYLRDPVGATVHEEWWGWRPMMPDGVPIIDRTPKWGNVFIAAGHSMLGVSMSTGTGRLIAELVDGKRPHIPVEPYRLGRF
jgi:D-amino-acid dehydrogenase